MVTFPTRGSHLRSLNDRKQDIQGLLLTFDGCRTQHGSGVQGFIGLGCRFLGLQFRDSRFSVWGFRVEGLGFSSFGGLVFGGASYKRIADTLGIEGNPLFCKGKCSDLTPPKLQSLKYMR